jgi:hypothetical protein
MVSKSFLVLILFILTAPTSFAKSTGKGIDALARASMELNRDIQKRETLRSMNCNSLNCVCDSKEADTAGLKGLCKKGVADAKERDSLMNEAERRIQYKHASEITTSREGISDSENLSPVQELLVAEVDELSRVVKKRDLLASMSCNSLTCSCTSTSEMHELGLSDFCKEGVYDSPLRQSHLDDAQRAILYRNSKRVGLAAYAVKDQENCSRKSGRRVPGRI